MAKKKIRKLLKKALEKLLLAALAHFMVLQNLARRRATDASGKCNG
jgi:hypothetical protein